MYLKGYAEGVANNAGMISSITKLMSLKRKATTRKISKEDLDNYVQEFDQIDGSKVEVDAEKLANFVKRLKVYGDVVQGENEESLKEILKKANNDVPAVIKYLTAKHKDNQVFQPPTIFKNNAEAHKPSLMRIKQKH